MFFWCGVLDRSQLKQNNRDLDKELGREIATSTRIRRERDSHIYIGSRLPLAVVPSKVSHNAFAQDSEREANATLRADAERRESEHKKEMRALKATNKSQAEQIAKLQENVNKYGHKRTVVSTIRKVFVLLLFGACILRVWVLST